MTQHCTLVTSLASERGMTQASSAYLATALAQAGWECYVVDLSGVVDYYDAPESLYMSCDSPQWLNPQAIRDADWMDAFLPGPPSLGERLVLFSALFSPDVPFHARLSHLVRLRHAEAITAIGGAALAGLRADQLDVVSRFFDFVLIGHDVVNLLHEPLSCSLGKRREGGAQVLRATAAPQFDPDYSLVPLNDFVSVYTGHGCYYGKCRFCDYPERAAQRITFRPPERVAEDVAQIYRLRPSVEDIVLTQDSYTKKHLTETANAIARKAEGAPYNLMFRAEGWVTREIGRLLAESGCTDVFIGAEAFDDEILQVLDKGVTAEEIVNAIRALSDYVNITLGVVLFVPGVSDQALVRQLRTVKQVLPHVESIEPEVLTVVNGSGFAKEPSRFGIILNATEGLLNDSWCYGLSQDVPWRMADTDLMRAWFAHAMELQKSCADYVKPLYWEAIASLADEFGVGT